MTTDKKGYETYPRPAPFVAPEKWEQPAFAAAPQLLHDPEEQPVASSALAAGERETE
ncbi:MAG TPA: hypothetical protein VIL68_09770 [Propionibacteriaceae bacterium]